MANNPSDEPLGGFNSTSFVGSTSAIGLPALSRIRAASILVLSGALCSCGAQPGTLFFDLEASEQADSTAQAADAGVVPRSGSPGAPNTGAGAAGSVPVTSSSSTATTNSTETNGNSTPETVGGASESQADPPAASVCDLGAFGEPVLLASVGPTGPQFGPTLSANALSLIFSAADEQANEDIFVALRTNRNEPFLTAEPLLTVNTDLFLEGTPYLTAQDHSLYFFSDRRAAGAPGGRDLWRTTRRESSLPFSEPAPVQGINTVGLEHLPWVSGDELALLLVSDRLAPTSGSNLWLATRERISEPFNEPSPLTGINANSRDERPFMSENGLTLFFCSNRQTSPADPVPTMNLWIAERGSRDDIFQQPEPLSELNSLGQDIDPTLSADGREIFFSSDRSGIHRLYRAERSCQ